MMADANGSGGAGPGSVGPAPATWLDAFASEGFEVRREREWEPAERHRGGLPDALEVPVAADEIALAVVVDADTDTVVVLPPDPGTDRDALGVARFSLTAEPGERGIVGVVARVLLSGPGRKVVNVLTGKVARAAAARWERRARPEGVRLFRPRDPVEGAPMTAEAWARLSGGPSLLWLHGPFVQTHTGFAGLDRDLWGALADRYQGRVWAYDHHTVSVAPRANARDLLRQVAEAGTGPLVVDVVAHSRGGLVARELAERSRDTPLTVRSLILAGTPNEGTPLADARGMIAGLNRFGNLLALAPDPVERHRRRSGRHRHPGPRRRRRRAPGPDRDGAPGQEPVVPRGAQRARAGDGRDLPLAGRRLPTRGRRLPHREGLRRLGRGHPPQGRHQRPGRARVAPPSAATGSRRAPARPSAVSPTQASGARRPSPRTSRTGSSAAPSP